MTFDNTKPHPSDALNLSELALYHLIMDYRADAGLDAIPLSVGLTTTAGRHAADTVYNIWEPGLVQEPGANLHSWSDAPYFDDHRDPNVMWDAPERIGTDYPGLGFEISAAGYGSVAAALEGWKSSPGHNAVILNEGQWQNQVWNAIGIGVVMDASVANFGGRIYHVWFGRKADPDGAGDIDGTRGRDTIDGTQFNDAIRGKRGNDTIDGGAGKDAINGDGGKDNVSGGDGRDNLSGGAGKDSLNGDAGRDVVNGGRGNDMLDGGGGRDLFVFDGKNFGRDRIGDYGRDRIRIDTEGEASTRAELAAALSDRKGNAVYDHNGDGKNVIVFEEVAVADLNLSLFDLG